MLTHNGEEENICKQYIDIFSSTSAINQRTVVGRLSSIQLAPQALQELQAPQEPQSSSPCGLSSVFASLNSLFDCSIKSTQARAFSNLVCLNGVRLQFQTNAILSFPPLSPLSPCSVHCNVNQISLSGKEAINKSLPQVSGLIGLCRTSEACSLDSCFTSHRCVR